MEELCLSVQLIVNLLLLSSQPLALSEDSLIVVNLLESWVLPYASEDLTLLVGNVINHDLGEPVAIVEIL